MISAVVLAFSGVVWALAGFPYLDKAIAFGILAAVCIVALKWIESRP